MNPASPFAKSKEWVAYFAAYIERELGIVYGPENFFQLENRLQEVARQFKMDGLEVLYETFKKGPTSQMRQFLLDSATNNETSFFRDLKPFEALKENILPELIQGTSQKIRIWSAACSTGQEAYSIAMILEELRSRFPSFEAEIYATDISERVLQRVKLARYSNLEIQRGLPPELQQKYFRQEQDAWTAKPVLRSYISTGVLNLCTNFHHLQPFHVIFCRNVLIYQSVERKIKILENLTKRLVPGGYLFLGAGESLLGLSRDFQTRNFGSIVYQFENSPQKKSVA